MNLFSSTEEVRLPESQKAFLRPIYIDKYQEWKNRMANLEKEYQELKPMLVALGIIDIKIEKVQEPNKLQSENDTTPIYSERLKGILSNIDLSIALSRNNYDSTWGWLKKCKYVIELANMRLTSNDIIDVVSDFFERELSKASLNNSIPATLSVAAKEGKIFRERNENGEYEYFLK